jgi:hypothetical protein
MQKQQQHTHADASLLANFIILQHAFHCAAGRGIFALLPSRRILFVHETSTLSGGGTLFCRPIRIMRALGSKRSLLAEGLFPGTIFHVSTPRLESG